MFKFIGGTAHCTAARFQATCHGSDSLVDVTSGVLFLDTQIAKQVLPHLRAWITNLSIVLFTASDRSERERRRRAGASLLTLRTNPPLNSSSSSKY